MTNMRTLALVLLLGGCSIYGGDDDDAPSDDVDAAIAELDAAPQADAAPVTTTYGVTWTCISTDCLSPLANESMVTVREVGAEASLVWFHEGATVPAAIHDASMSGGCFAVAAGTDGGLPRSTYEVCAGPSGGLRAVITWGSSTWTATMTQL